MEEMEPRENQREREEIYSKVVRAGKRTYFFDVKSTKAEDYYLTITESKKRFSNEEGKFQYEKHKLFLYKEDFEKFADGLEEVIEFIRTGKVPVSDFQETKNTDFSDVSFDDLKEV